MLLVSQRSLKSCFAFARLRVLRLLFYNWRRQMENYIFKSPPNLRFHAHKHLGDGHFHQSAKHFVSICSGYFNVRSQWPVRSHKKNKKTIAACTVTVSLICLFTPSACLSDLPVYPICPSFWSACLSVLPCVPISESSAFSGVLGPAVRLLGLDLRSGRAPSRSDT